MPEQKKRRIIELLKRRPQLIPAALALLIYLAGLAIGTVPYAYLALFFLLLSITALMMAVVCTALKRRFFWASLLFALVAILFNPLIPRISPDGFRYYPVPLMPAGVTAILFLVAIFVVRKPRLWRTHWGRVILLSAVFTCGSFLFGFEVEGYMWPRPLHLGHCKSNLSIIGRGLRMYAADHNGQFPAELQQLLAQAYLPTHGVLQCPDEPDKDGPPDYIYVPNVHPPELRQPGSIVIVYGKIGNHPNFPGRHVLFADRHVEWMKEEEFQELMKKQPAYK